MTRYRDLAVRTGRTVLDADGNPRTERTIEPRRVAVFRQVPDEVTLALADFLDARNLGRGLTVDGQRYTLDYLSVTTGGPRRGFSVYYLTGRSVVRISNHWSVSRGHPRSRLLNCGQIDSAWWEIDNRTVETVPVTYRSGRYPWQTLAGVCGKTVLNQTVPHWRTPR